MAASLLALLDDIASVLDDVSVLTKVAAKKTAAVLGDDLALNAQQVSGVMAERELPVVWAVCKGSLANKAILVPAALAISAFAPWAITPLLMLGGAYLCCEGFQKLAHGLARRRQEPSPPPQARPRGAGHAASTDVAAAERRKIKGAVQTDFVLSAEIITITLGTVQQSAFGTQVVVMAGIAVLMTVGVYGVVAAIVKLDDAGLFLSRRGGWQAALGHGILAAAPWLMKGLTVVGTAAMFLVGGGILTHGIGALRHGIETAATAAAIWPGGAFFHALVPALLNALVGMAAGAVVLGSITLAGKARR